MASAFGLDIVRHYLVDGPHIEREPGERFRLNGIINSKTFFDYAVIKGETINLRFALLVFRPKYMPIAVIHDIMWYLAITLWCLIPYLRAAGKHFRRVNEFVASFSNHTALKIEREKQDADIEHIRKLHEMIWNGKTDEYNMKTQ